MLQNINNVICSCFRTLPFSMACDASLYFLIYSNYINWYTHKYGVRAAMSRQSIAATTWIGGFQPRTGAEAESLSCWFWSTVLVTVSHYTADLTLINFRDARWRSLDQTVTGDAQLIKKTNAQKWKYFRFCWKHLHLALFALCTLVAYSSVSPRWLP